MRLWHLGFAIAALLVLAVPAGAQTISLDVESDGRATATVAVTSSSFATLVASPAPFAVSFNPGRGGPGDWETTMVVFGNGAAPGRYQFEVVVDGDDGSTTSFTVDVTVPGPPVATTPTSTAITPPPTQAPPPTRAPTATEAPPPTQPPATTVAPASSVAATQAAAPSGPPGGRGPGAGELGMALGLAVGGAVGVAGAVWVVRRRAVVARVNLPSRPVQVVPRARREARPPAP